MPDSFFPDRITPAEVTVAYTLTTAPTATLQIGLGNEGWTGSDAVHQIAFSPDNRLLIAGGWGDHIVLVDLMTEEMHTLPPEVGAVFALSPDGRLLATGNAAGQVQVWEAETGAIHATLGQHAAGNITALAFSADGRTVFSADETGEVRAWAAP